jgi:hypothetical protein
LLLPADEAHVDGDPDGGIGFAVLEQVLARSGSQLGERREVEVHIPKRAAMGVVAVRQLLDLQLET